MARRAEVATSTVRYYERIRLLTPPRRTESNYRLYTSDAVERLRFIRA
ncbi:MAG: MerR family transcriptional regulator, partial [Acidobacteria bacterium]|nr:MerR family transcriptional regulator [Acidobacteriota bacterium]